MHGTGPPRVSVVMAVHNVAACVSEAVESILASTCPDFEFIIIDDGSTDGTREVLTRYADPRIRLLFQEKRGIVTSANRGIREARGVYIARMDGDDVSLPHRLACQVEFLDRHPDIVLLGGQCAEMDEEGRPLSPIRPYPTGHEAIWKAMRRAGAQLCHPTVIFRRAQALEVGLYDPDFRWVEDLEFFARLMSAYRAANLPEVVLRYRIRRRSVNTLYPRLQAYGRRLVHVMMKRFEATGRYAATPSEREALRRLAAGDEGRCVSQRHIEARYCCRVGRALLRAGRWREAALQYRRSIGLQPVQWLAYTGLLRAGLHREMAPGR